MCLLNSAVSDGDITHDIKAEMVQNWTRLTVASTELSVTAISGFACWYCSCRVISLLILPRTYTQSQNDPSPELCSNLATAVTNTEIALAGQEPQGVADKSLWASGIMYSSMAIILYGSYSGQTPVILAVSVLPAAAITKSVANTLVRLEIKSKINLLSSDNAENYPDASSVHYQKAQLIMLSLATGIISGSAISTILERTGASHRGAGFISRIAAPCIGSMAAIFSLADIEPDYDLQEELTLLFKQQIIIGFLIYFQAYYGPMGAIVSLPMSIILFSQIRSGSAGRKAGSSIQILNRLGFRSGAPVIMIAGALAGGAAGHYFFRSFSPLVSAIISSNIASGYATRDSAVFNEFHIAALTAILVNGLSGAISEVYAAASLAASHNETIDDTTDSFDSSEIYAHLLAGAGAAAIVTILLNHRGGVVNPICAAASNMLTVLTLALINGISNFASELKSIEETFSSTNDLILKKFSAIEEYLYIFLW